MKGHPEMKELYIHSLSLENHDALRSFFLSGKTYCELSSGEKETLQIAVYRMMVPEITGNPENVTLAKSRLDCDIRNTAYTKLIVNLRKGENTGRSTFLDVIAGNASDMEGFISGLSAYVCATMKNAGRDYFRKHTVTLFRNEIHDCGNAGVKVNEISIDTSIKGKRAIADQTGATDPMLVSVDNSFDDLIENCRSTRQKAGIMLKLLKHLGYDINDIEMNLKSGSYEEIRFGLSVIISSHLLSFRTADNLYHSLLECRDRNLYSVVQSAELYLRTAVRCA